MDGLVGDLEEDGAHDVVGKGEGNTEQLIFSVTTRKTVSVVTPSNVQESFVLELQNKSKVVSMWVNFMTRSHRHKNERKP